MIIHYSIKQLGKKRPTIQRTAIELPQLEASSTLKEFIQLLVQQQVQAYEKRQESVLLQALTPSQIEEQAAAGKVNLLERLEKRPVELKAAQQEAIQAFEDGLYAVFADEQQLEALETSMNWAAVDCFTFVRLTFLAGSIW